MNKIKKIFENNILEIPPVWFLRQAGRHIPEYYSIRSKSKSFIDFCLNKDLIYESTLLPLKYYDLDAAIIFSDILMIPWCMDRDVKFIPGIGPSLKPLEPGSSSILKNANIVNLMDPLNIAIKNVRNKLDPNISLIGFAGAPWTLACYMIDGQGSKDFNKTRVALWSYEKWFLELIDTLVNYITDILEMQANAGADVLMIFDSWSHMIPATFWDVLAIKTTRTIIENLRKRNIFKPVIGFPFKGGGSIVKYSYESNVDCIALDWTVDLVWAKENLNKNIVLQGNLDPLSLVSGGFNLEKNVSFILDTMSDRRHIFNLGHGITPECKIKNISRVLQIINNKKKYMV